MPHLLVAGKLHPKGRAILEAAPNLTVTYVDEPGAAYVRHLADADALLIRTQPLTRETVALAPRLRFVSRHGVGYDSVDVAALSDRGIPLAVCGDVNSSAVAEHAMMLMLAATKRVLRADTAVRSGGWTWRDRLEPQDLAGRTLLLLGYGRVGRHTARMAAGFGLTVRAYDPVLLETGWPEGPVRAVRRLEDGLGWADVISVSVPRAERPLLGAAEFGAMKDGVILVNTARGGIVEETALIEALASGRVGAAGFDVFDTEPLPPGHPLTRFDQVILTPHVAGVTEGASERMATGSSENVVAFFEGRLDPAFVVNRDRIGWPGR